MGQPNWKEHVTLLLGCIFASNVTVLITLIFAGIGHQKNLLPCGLMDIYD
jgi:hypothetical protein